jgi:WD40 repeat protein
MAASPLDRTLLLTNGSSSISDTPSTTLWRIPDSTFDPIPSSTNHDDTDNETDSYHNDDQDNDPYNNSNNPYQSNYNYNTNSSGNHIGMDFPNDVDESDDSNHRTSMEEITFLPVSSGDGHGLEGRLTEILWHSDALEASRTAVVTTLSYTGILSQWDFESGDAQELIRIDTTSKSTSNVMTTVPPRAAWDPHDANLVSVTNKSGVDTYDTRTGNICWRLPHCHRLGGATTDLDWNPNKPHTLVTTGQTGVLKFWDVRQLSSRSSDDDSSSSSSFSSSQWRMPLKVVKGGHLHQTNHVEYNKFHDQLLLSSGTDSVVNLWRMSSVSSAPLLDTDTASNAGVHDAANNSLGGGAADVRVARHEHQDSVYGMTWSAADAWLYLTLGYDGNVVLHHVPSKEKYKILL